MGRQVQIPTSHLILLTYAKFFSIFYSKKVQSVQTLPLSFTKLFTEKTVKVVLLSICWPARLLHFAWNKQIENNVYCWWQSSHANTTYFIERSTKNSLSQRKNFGKLIGIFHSITKGTKISSPHKQFTHNLYHLLFVLQLPFSSLYKVCENPYLFIENCRQKRRRQFQ